MYKRQVEWTVVFLMLVVFSRCETMLGDLLLSMRLDMNKGVCCVCVAL